MAKFYVTVTKEFAILTSISLIQEVNADHAEIKDGTLVFSDLAQARPFTIMAFAPGTWLCVTR